VPHLGKSICAEVFTGVPDGIVPGGGSVVIFDTFHADTAGSQPTLTRQTIMMKRAGIFRGDLIIVREFKGDLS
jgi:hypothetical protein